MVYRRRGAMKALELGKHVVVGDVTHDTYGITDTGLYRQAAPRAAGGPCAAITSGDFPGFD